jgi:hypothetical protein
MPLTNAEKQSRQRARVKQKLRDLRAIEDGLHGKDADVVNWLKRSIRLCRALEFPKRSHIWDVERAAKAIMDLIDTEPDDFAARVIADMGKRVRR